MYVLSQWNTAMHTVMVRVVVCILHMKNAINRIARCIREVHMVNQCALGWCWILYKLMETEKLDISLTIAEF